MGSVIQRSYFLGEQREKRKTREKLIYLTIGLAYFVAGFAFVTIGLQPVKQASSVYAAEAETATSLLTIDSINLHAPVKPVVLNDKTLEVPEQIAGSYSVHNNKTLIIGHSSTIFADLKDLKTDDKITYNGKTFTITAIEEKEKQDISMPEILKAEETDTLVLMTCSGDKIAGTTGDHTHRLIITAR